MTGIKVVDASALAALLFAEPEAEAIAVRLEGARLAAPSRCRCHRRIDRHIAMRHSLGGPAGRRI
ncbi:MAG TPA: hypothetical protein VGL35_11530 [Rhizomicrobium sp.]